MEGLIIILGGVDVVALGLAIWINTKSGKKWLYSL